MTNADAKKKRGISNIVILATGVEGDSTAIEIGTRFADKTNVSITLIALADRQKYPREVRRAVKSLKSLASTNSNIKFVELNVKAETAKEVSNFIFYFIFLNNFWGEIANAAIP